MTLMMVEREAREEGREEGIKLGIETGQKIVDDVANSIQESLIKSTVAMIRLLREFGISDTVIVDELLSVFNELTQA